MVGLSTTTTGHDICEHVISVLEKFGQNPAKLCGSATEGVLSMIGMTNGFTMKFLDAVGAQDVVVSHSIIHPENQRTKALAFAEVMKNVVERVNYITARGLNHRQFKALLEYLDCDYPDEVYLSAVRWISRVSTVKRFQI